MKKQAQKSYASFIIWGVFALAIVGLISLIIRSSQDNVDVSTQTSVLEVKSDDWTKGPESALVTLVEYGDFQCPACAQYFPMLNQLSTDFPTELRIAYRHFPLTSIHSNAFDAARAADAAGRQGRFWEMHDRLYSMQSDWAPLNRAKDRFIDYAEQMGFDKDKFEKDISDSEITKNVNEDMASAQVLRLNSTPTFFLNGARIQPRGYKEFKTLIQNAIDVASKSKTENEDKTQSLDISNEDAVSDSKSSGSVIGNSAVAQ